MEMSSRQSMRESVLSVETTRQNVQQGSAKGGPENLARQIIFIMTLKFLPFYLQKCESFILCINALFRGELTVLF